MHKMHGGELYFEFSEETESLRILKNSVRWSLSWCKCAQKELLFELREKRSVTGGDTHRVTEHPTGSAKRAWVGSFQRALTSLQGEKGTKTLWGQSLR